MDYDEIMVLSWGFGTVFIKQNVQCAGEDFLIRGASLTVSISHYYDFTFVEWNMKLVSDLHPHDIFVTTFRPYIERTCRDSCLILSNWMNPNQCTFYVF